MQRRSFLALATCAMAQSGQPRIPNSVLVHEHILVDFIGAAKASRDRYQRADVIRRALPLLKAIRELGCVRMLECTPNFLGRDPVLLRELSEQSGIELWTNTGLYAANQYKHLPEYALAENAEQLARRWIAEARGIEGTKPRFLKIGVNQGPLPELDKKIVRAAALTSKETGLPIAAHTGNGIAALEELEIVQSAGVAASKFIWVHAQNEKDHAIRKRVAEAGAWVELDAVNGQPDWHKECVDQLIAQGLLGRVLVSQDSGWYRVGEPEGGEFRGYTGIYEQFLPRFDRKVAEQLVVQNPRRAFGD